MVGRKFDPKLFFQAADSVVLHMAAAELFGLLKRSLDLPSAWAALLTRTTGDHTVVPAGGMVEASDVEDILFARVTPVEVSVEEDNLVTREECVGQPSGCSVGWPGVVSAAGASGGACSVCRGT